MFPSKRRAYFLLLLALMLTILPAALCANPKTDKTIQLKTAVVLPGIGAHKAGEGIVVAGLDAMLTERLHKTQHFLVDLMAAPSPASEGSQSEPAETVPKATPPAISGLEWSTSPTTPQIMFDIVCIDQQKGAMNFDLGKLIKNVDARGTHFTLSVGVLIRAYDTRQKRVVSAWIGYGTASATSWEVELLQKKPDSTDSDSSTSGSTSAGETDAGDDTAPSANLNSDAASHGAESSSHSRSSSLQTAQRGLRLQISKTPSLRLALARAMDNSLKKMLNELDASPWVSYVAASKNGKVYLASGKLEGIQIGQRLIVKHPNELLRHPVTQRVLGMDYAPVGQLRIEQVNANYAIGVMESGTAAKGDHVFLDADIAAK